MPDLDKNKNANNNDFMIEKIKERPINRRKLIRRTLITVLMAVIFGLVACLTFLILEPVFTNWLRPEEEPDIVIFPEDQQEMMPEEMLSENIEPEETPEPEVENVVTEEQIQEILDDVTLNRDSYKQLYGALSDYVAELEQYMVVVTSVESDVGWFSDVYESESHTSGVIVGNNGRELLILTNYGAIDEADWIQVSFHNGITVDAQIVQYHSETDLAVLCINLNVMSQVMPDEEFHVAPFGFSTSKGLLGSPVIAMGSPMGSSGSIGYGIITSTGGQLTKVDGNYGILSTDIYGSRNASGALFDMNGRLIGFITNEKTSSDMSNMITAYGISGLRRLITGLSTGSKIAYMGILGIDVTAKINEEYGVPVGAYIREIEMDSPAMQAGVQQGDVIVGIGDRTVNGISDYMDIILSTNVGNTIRLKVMRQSQEEYREMEFEIVLAEAH